MMSFLYRKVFDTRMTLLLTINFVILYFIDLFILLWAQYLVTTCLQGWYDEWMKLKIAFQTVQNQF